MNSNWLKIDSWETEKFDIGDRTARRDIIDLEEKGLLIKTGDLKTSEYLYKDKIDR
ncbi:DeoR family transcriptional regulator [Algoriphagus vanfongensis]|uniref:DeoR family transcriptional regulator n=1 Tax=Algoriphagus vanfongensis TaxID=426371 RepID=UPI0003F6B592